MLDLRVAQLEALVALPDHHRDPFDHLLIAQARIEGAPFVAAAPNAARYDVETIVRAP